MSQLLTLGDNTPRTVTFHRADGTQVGAFDFSNDPVTFTGDADESAQLFIKAVIQWFPQIVEQRGKEQPVANPEHRTSAEIAREAARQYYKYEATEHDTYLGSRDALEAIITRALEQATAAEREKQEKWEHVAADYDCHSPSELALFLTKAEQASSADEDERDKLVQQVAALREALDKCKGVLEAQAQSGEETHDHYVLMAKRLLTEHVNPALSDTEQPTQEEG